MELTMTKILAGLVLVLAITAGAFAYLANDRGGKLDVAASDARNASQTIANLQQAQLDNGSTIAGLQTRLNTCAGQAQDVMLASYIASVNAANAAKQRDQAADAAQHARGVTYATDPTAGAWAADHLPPAVSDELRQSWNEADRHDHDHPD